MGHGKTGMESGHWQDTGETGMGTYLDDEFALTRAARERFPALPLFVYGHSWGSMLAREYAARAPETLSGLILGGIARDMYGAGRVDRAGLADRVAEGRGAEPAEEFVGALFERTLERFGPDAGQTDWVAKDPGVVADHARDPLNNFSAMMTIRFLRDFMELYDAANAEDWPARVGAALPVLILAGDQDPVAGYGSGAYSAANALWANGSRDVRTRVYTGMRHEVHNEPETRDDVVAEILAFVEAHLSPRPRHPGGPAYSDDEVEALPDDLRGGH